MAIEKYIMEIDAVQYDGTNKEEIDNFLEKIYHGNFITIEKDSSLLIFSTKKTHTNPSLISEYSEYISSILKNWWVTSNPFKPDIMCPHDFNELFKKKILTPINDLIQTNDLIPTQ